VLISSETGCASTVPTIDPSSYSPPPRPSLATVLHSAWFGPAVLAGVFLVMMTLLLWTVARSNHRSAVDQLQTSGNSAREAVRQRLTATTEYFLVLAEEFDRQTQDEPWLRDRVRQHKADHAELLGVMQINAAGEPVWCSNGPVCEAQYRTAAMVRIPIETATRTSQITCSMPYQDAQDELVMVMVVPLKRQGQPAGALAAVYSWNQLLTTAIPRDAFEKHEVSLLDEHRNVFQSIANGERLDTRLSYVEPLPPPLPPQQLFLKFVPYGSGFWSIPMTLLMLTSTGLVLGMAWGMWSLKRQVADRRQAELDLRLTRDELERRVHQRTADLERANVQLQMEMTQRQSAELYVRKHQEHLAHVGRVSTMAEMAAGMAHELNQPLGSIGSYADGCMRMIEGGQTDSSELRAAISEIGDQVRRAGHIIHRLRRLVSEGGEPELVRSDIKRVINQVVNLLLPSIRQHQVHLALELEKELPPVMVDSIQIQQVLLNLMKNAIEAMSANAASVHRLLVVEARRQFVEGVAKVELSVADTGPGCDPVLMPRIFDAFFTTKKGGMGMGLSVSRTIIEAHGGDLSVEVNSPQGLIVKFMLDAAEARPERPPQQSERTLRRVHV